MAASRPVREAAGRHFLRSKRLATDLVAEAEIARRLERRSRPRVPVELHERYWRFLTNAFAAREPLRRGLRPSLSPLEVKRLAPALGFSPEARPWEVDAEQWAKLFAFACQRAAR